MRRKRTKVEGVLLRTLRVRNFAIIDDAEVSFEPGLNVITGETGAGKTLVLRALGVVLGDRVDAEIVRAGADEASIEAEFEARGEEIEKVLEDGGFGSDGEMVIRRVVFGNGRTRVYLNGHLASLSVLGTLAPLLVKAYGQHEYEALRRVESHLELLDGVAGLGMTVAEMGRRYGEYSEARRRLHDLESQKATASARSDLLRFQVSELSGAAITKGELTTLAAERSRYANAQKLLELARGVEGGLYSVEGAAVEVVGRAIAQLREMETIDSDVRETRALLEAALAQLEEAGLWTGRYAERVECDPERLAAIESRLEEIGRLARKYDVPADSLPELCATLDAELSGIDVSEVAIGEARAAFELAEKEAVQWARKLSVERRKAAKDLERRMETELASLGMEGAKLTVQFADPPPEGHALGARGRDQVEFHLAANPGEPSRPLAKVASGGEMSRIMLALKALGATGGPGAAMIFDEVDAGIGGTVAEVVGQKLKSLGARGQVICITHLPQIAAFAAHHHGVTKEALDGRTVAVVRRLERDEKIRELARMLGGSTIRQETQHHAQEMLRAAGDPG